MISVVAATLSMLFGCLAVVGALGHASSERARRRRIERARSGRVTELPPGELVEVVGRVVPTEAGVVTSPASGRAGVVHRTEVYDQTGDQSDLVHSADARVPFWVEDASGGRALVIPEGADLMVRCLELGTGVPEDFWSDYRIDGNGSVRRREPIGGSVLEWAQAVGGRIHQSYLVKEWSILAGDTLHVFGTLERGPAGRLAFSARGPESLLLSAHDRRELARMARARRSVNRFGIVILVLLSSVFGAVAVAARLSGP